MSNNLIHAKYRPDIDGLRAIAVLLVVIFHAFPAVMPGGFIGVDIFFVISGFLISTIIISNLKKGTFRFGEFYGRRIKRIFPALSLVMVACFALGWFALLPYEYKQLGKHLVGGASFTSNFMLWEEHGYFDTASETKPLLHLWSLGVEEQFYLIWPIILWFAHRRGLNSLHVAIGIFLVSFIFNVAMIYEDATNTFYSPLTRFWELQIGSILALLTQQHKVADWAWRKKCLSAGLGLIVVALMTLSQVNYFPGWWAILPTFGAALIVFSGIESESSQSILTNRVIVWFGTISYPLYLWHWPLLSFAHIMESGVPSYYIRIVCVLLSIGLAWLTYRMIEMPIRFGTSARLTAPTLTALLLSVGVIGGIGYSYNGFSDRPNVLPFMDRVTQLNWKWFTSKDCKIQYAGLNNEFCQKSKMSAPTVLILGDSHSNHLYPGMAEAVMGTTETVANFGSVGCMPFFTIGDTFFNVNIETREKRKSCARLANAALQFAEDNSSVKTVILSAYWAPYISGEWHGNYNENGKSWTNMKLVSNNPKNLDPRQTFKTAMQSTITSLLSKNKQVIFVLDTPDMGFDPISCVKGRPLTISSRVGRYPCAVPRKDFEERSQDYRSLVVDTLKKFPAVKVFDASALMCDTQMCWAIKNGKLLYRDGNHLSIEGSRLIAKELVKLL